ncbi:MAG: SigE family RNA polymerase sigma factor [Frankiales bacterium]|nr:SigE family RNA polymerase sigma factor [Frankiales bacterium]
MDARLSEYVRGQWPSLVRYATLLCGDAVEAEELVQSALVRVALRWPLVHDKDNPDGYVKRAIVRGQINGWRRIGRHETVVSALPDVVVGDGLAAYDEHDAVRRALATLPPRQRAVLVLRYLDDRTEQQTAAMLGCSVGTVKSQAHKALAKLRECVGADGVLS